MFASMHPSACVGAHVYKCTPRPKVDIMFTHYSLPCFLRQSFSEPEACRFGRFAGWLAQLDPLVSAFPLLGLQMRTAGPGLFVFSEKHSVS